MASPIVSWRNEASTQQVSQWNVGTVDAGAISSEFTVTIWNNHSGSTAVSDMTNCTITTKDSAGGNTGELVTDKWIEVKPSGETSFTKIGGTTTKAIKAVNSTVGAGIIKGTANNGSTTADTNYARVTLRANVPPNATAGIVNFLTRVSYRYV